MLKWKNPKHIKGYQIEYSLKKDFSAAGKVKIRKASRLSTTIKGLKAGRKYYVRIRTYATVKKKNYYSAWSDTVAVKTKGKPAEAAKQGLVLLETDDSQEVISELGEGSMRFEETSSEP